MPYFTYDTSVIISRRLTQFDRMLGKFLMSAIALMELTASASDSSQRKLYEQLFQHYRGRDRLIVPNVDDWLLASKVLFFLTHTRKRSQKGKLRPLPAGASQRMALDVLIAVTARRWKAIVVTENWDDFKVIKRYCNATIVKANEFFG